MFQFDHDKFFNEFRLNLGPLSQSQVDGLTFLLGKMEQDSGNWQNLSQLAYGFATFMWESARHFTPITEFGSPSYFDKYNAGTPIGKNLGNTQPGDGYKFRGRGYVQITGRANYDRIGKLLNVDLVNTPDKALDPETAYLIAAQGMQCGWFTGRNLARFIPSDDQAQFQPARQIINGLDHAADIAAIATKMLCTLRDSLVPAATPVPTEAPIAS